MLFYVIIRFDHIFIFWKRSCGVAGVEEKAEDTWLKSIMISFLDASMRRCVRPLVRPSIRPSVHPLVGLSVYPLVGLSVHPLLGWSVGPSICYQFSFISEFPQELRNNQASWESPPSYHTASSKLLLLLLLLHHYCHHHYTSYTITKDVAPTRSC